MRMTEQQIRTFVTRYPWTFAKTYAEKAPHEYYVKYELDEVGQQDFEQFVMFIRENGFAAEFWGETHIYYELDGCYYWTMGEPLEDTYILNRCEASDYSLKDGVMDWKGTSRRKEKIERIARRFTEQSQVAVYNGDGTKTIYALGEKSITVKVDSDPNELQDEKAKPDDHGIGEMFED